MKGLSSGKTGLNLLTSPIDLQCGVTTIKDDYGSITRRFTAYYSIYEAWPSVSKIVKSMHGKLKKKK